MKKKIITMILGLALIGGIGSCSSKPTKVAEKSTTKTVEQKEPVKNQTKTFKIGDVVQLSDYKVTVNKVYPVKSNNEITQPKEGNEFLAIDCTVENISSSEKSISSIMMFKVVDKDGRACEYSISALMAANAGQLDGTLGAGRKMTGVYAIEVPKGTTGLELEFDSSLLTSGQVIVTLN